MHAADTQYSRSFRRALTGIEVGQEITPPPLLPELSARETVSIYDPERLSPELAELAAEAAPRNPQSTFPSSRIENGKDVGVWGRK